MIFRSCREEQCTQKVAVDSVADTATQGEGQVIRVREDNFHTIKPVNEGKIWRNKYGMNPKSVISIFKSEAHRSRQAESLVTRR